MPQGAGSFAIENTMWVNHYNPALAYDPANGQFLAAWRSDSGTAYGRRIDAVTGQLLDTTFQIEDSTANGIDLDAGHSVLGGSYLVSWRTSGTVYARRVQPDDTVGNLEQLMSASNLEWPRVSAHPAVARFLVAAVDEGTDQVVGRLVGAADGTPVGNQFLVTPAGDNPEGIGTTANPHDHSLAVGYYDLTTGSPKISFANGLCVSGDPATTTESGATATIGVRLCAAPSADVVVDVVSTDTGEGTVDPAHLTFTTADWSTEKTVTVSPVDDGVVDGSVTYLVTLTVDDAVSPDDYDGVIDAVTVTNVDLEGLIFYDGFESGDTSMWTEEVQ